MFKSLSIKFLLAICPVKRFFYELVLIFLVLANQAETLQKSCYGDLKGRKIEGILRYNRVSFGLFFTRFGYVEYGQNACSVKLRPVG